MPVPDAVDASGPQQTSNRFWGGLVAVGAMWAAAPALRGGFVHDDRTLIENSQKVGDWSTLPEALVSDLFWLSETVRPSPYWRPWVTASYYMDHALGAGDAWAFHLHNAVLLVLLVVLVWWTAGRGWRGACVGMLLALHPAMVEPLANITARTDLYVALLGTSALVLPRRWGFPALVMALACKETAVWVPLLWALLELHRGWRPAWQSSRAGWAIVAIWMMLRMLVVGGRRQGAIWDGWGAIPGTLVVALDRVWLPGAGPRPDVDLSDVADAGIPGGLLVVGTTVLGLGWLARRHRSAVWLAVVMLPLLLTSGLAGPGIRMADGLLTWALVGFALLLARLPAPALLAFVPLVVLLAGGHSERVGVWQSPEQLWRAALSARPDDPRVRLKAGRVALSTDPLRARQLAWMVLDHPDARLRREGHELIARSWLLEGPSTPGREAGLREALLHAADPDDPESGWACAARCVWDEQVPGPERMGICEAAIRQGAASGDVWNTLGILQAGNQELKKARDAFASAVQLDPERLEFRQNLALAERMLRREAPSGQN